MAGMVVRPRAPSGPSPASPDPRRAAERSGGGFDTASKRSVGSPASSPRPLGRGETAGHRPARADPSPDGAVVAAGFDRPAGSTTVRPSGVVRELSGFPIQVAKVRRPPLRDDVLTRERLTAWLEAKTAHRLVFVTAEAGYGKTTLLADWTRHTTRRVLWYRLDPDDRDWVAFLNHLVASGRQADPAFGDEAGLLLAQLGPGGPTRDAIVAALARELQRFADEGATIILDDFHAVDDVPEIVDVVRCLIERAPEQVSHVVASRRPADLGIARLKALGSVAQLQAIDLQFDEAETDRLFRDAYHHPLDPDVLQDLAVRTEGWAASLQLVRTAIREHSATEVRSFVHRLSGARGEIHDYLAEEVVGKLRPQLQQFLMRTSVLDAVEADAAAVAYPDGAHDIERLIDEAEELHLLSRRGDDDSPHRFHPLVREFLQARLRAEIGTEGVRCLNLELGRRFEGRNWRISATHYAAAGEHEAAERVVERSIHEVMGSALYNVALEILRGAADVRAPAITMILRSRVLLQQGQAVAALGVAQDAVTAARVADQHIGTAVLNMASVESHVGEPDRAAHLANVAIDEGLTEEQRELALAVLALHEMARDGDLARWTHELSNLAEKQDVRGETHHAGITHLNLALALYWMKDPEHAVRRADRAESALAHSKGYEVASARLAKARALAYMKRWAEACDLIERSIADANVLARAEALAEAATTHARYGDLDCARAYIARANLSEGFLPPTTERLLLIARAEVSIREGRIADALPLIEEARDRPSADICAQLEVALVRSRIALRMGDQNVGTLIENGLLMARRQSANLAIGVFELLAAIARGPDPTSRVILGLDPRDSAMLSWVADEFALAAPSLTQEAQDRLADEARSRPARWRTSARAALASGADDRLWNAQLLDEIGTVHDIGVLRSVAHSSRRPRHTTSATLGRELARRLAPRVFVEDEGFVRLRIGDRTIVGSEIRRKVLALACFLLTRRDMAATRDQVLDALWPEVEPETASNSLNQTIYILRRVFEPEFSDDRTPGYVQLEGDVLRFDPELVDSRSRQSTRMAERCIRNPSPRLIEEMVTNYQGKFALDFVYEDWSQTYRDTLHAAYLGIVERAASRDLVTGRSDRAMFVLKRAISIDPDADSLELTLLRAYRDTGSRAAAAEQYEHYARTLGDIGIDAPPLEGA